MAKTAAELLEMEEQLNNVDLTALPPGHFENDNKAEEDMFKNEYGVPGVGPNNIEKDETIDPDTGLPKVVPPAAEEEEEFKFDETLKDSEKEELIKANAMFNTNFTDLNELKNALNKKDNSEQKTEIQENRRFIDYYKSVLEYPSEKIVREDKIIKAQQKGIDTKDESFIDQLDIEIEKMTDGGFLDYAADSLKSAVRGEMDKLVTKVSTFDTSQKETKEQAEASFKTKLQEGVSSLFKEKTFLGIQVKKDDLLEIYSDVSKNKHIDHLKENPTDAVKFAFFLKHEKIISELMKKPGYQEGVQKTLKEMGMQSSSTSTKTVSDDKGDNEENLSFLQKFIK